MERWHSYRPHCSTERVYQLDEASRAVAGARCRSVDHAVQREAHALLAHRGYSGVSDVYASEATGRPHGDADEVVNYVRALELGIERLAELPICTRLVLELHAELLSGVRGQDKRPGSYAVKSGRLRPPASCHHLPTTSPI